MTRWWWWCCCSLPCHGSCGLSATKAPLQGTVTTRDMLSTTEIPCMHVLCYLYLRSHTPWMTGWQYNITIISEGGWQAAAAAGGRFLLHGEKLFLISIFQLSWDGGSKIRSPFVLSLTVILCCKFLIIIKCDRVLPLLVGERMGLPIFPLYYILWDSTELLLTHPFPSSWKPSLEHGSGWSTFERGGGVG